MKILEKNFFCCIVTGLMLTFSGCGDDNDNEPDMPTNTPVVEQEYYVKYEAKVTSIYTGTLRYIVNTDNGSKTFIEGKNFSKTFGPVKKGFNASIEADLSGWFSGYADVYIYVCRGSEPFALKASSRTSVQYKIDY